MRQQWDEGPAVHIVSGLSMGVVGTLMYMPADAVRTQCYNGAQSAPPTTAAILRIGSRLARDGGPGAFYKGTSVALARTVPACVMFPVTMEWARKALGLEYF